MMRNEIRQRIENALDAVGDAEYLAYRYDDSFPYNELYQSRVGGAMDEIVQLSDMPFEKSWVFDKLRMEVAENLLQYPADRLFIMKETIWGLFPRFCIKWPDFLETLDVTICSYGQNIIQCSILDTWTSDHWKSCTKADDDTKEYLYRANLMALHIIEALQDIVDKGSFDARDSHTGKSLLNDEQPANAQPLDDGQCVAVPATRNEIETKKQIVIDREALKKHFTIRFQRDGYFDMLVSDIADLHTQKDCATVAKMAFNSKGFIPTFSTFAAWCRVFFEIVGLTVTEKYNFSKYEPPTDKLKRKFYYLV